MTVRKQLKSQFGGIGPIVQNDGTAASGTAAEINQLITSDGLLLEHQVVGTQTIIAPVMLAGAAGTQYGLDIGQDQTATDGCIVTFGGNHQRNIGAFVIGTDPAFQARLKIRVADVSGAKLYFGFKGSASAANPIQANTATFADYTDKATIGLNGAAITIVTALNNAADTTTDTTNVAADGVALELQVLVSSAGVVTYKHDDASAGTLAAPTATAAFTFDTGDTVVPFLHFTHDTDVAGSVELLSFVCGYQ
jgi:hypothetical protein